MVRLSKIYYQRQTDPCSVTSQILTTCRSRRPLDEANIPAGAAATLGGTATSSAPTSTSADRLRILRFPGQRFRMSSAFGRPTSNKHLPPHSLYPAGTELAPSACTRAPCPSRRAPHRRPTDASMCSSHRPDLLSVRQRAEFRATDALPSSNNNGMTPASHRLHARNLGPGLLRDRFMRYCGFMASIGPSPPSSSLTALAKLPAVPSFKAPVAAASSPRDGLRPTRRSVICPARARLCVSLSICHHHRHVALSSLPPSPPPSTRLPHHHRHRVSALQRPGPTPPRRLTLIPRFACHATHDLAAHARVRALPLAAIMNWDSSQA